MTILDELERLSKEATPGPWGVQPGCGHDEDEGCMFVSAVGPSYSFLIDDEWEYAPDPIPMGILKETEAQRRAVADQYFIRAAEAQRRAVADQYFIRAARQHIDALIQVARAAESLDIEMRLRPFSPDTWVISELRKSLEKLK